MLDEIFEGLGVIALRNDDVREVLERLEVVSIREEVPEVREVLERLEDVTIREEIPEVLRTLEVVFEK